MRPIHQSTPPTSFATYRSTHATFGQLSSDIDIRQALWEEQQGHCAYYEKHLREPRRFPDSHNTRIEHFHPQSGPSSNNGTLASDCPYAAERRRKTARLSLGRTSFSAAMETRNQARALPATRRRGITTSVHPSGTQRFGHPPKRSSSLIVQVKHDL